MSDRISICIPTCDRPELIGETLESALSQDPAPYEVVVGDDSTTERTAEIIRAYEQTESVRYIRNEPPRGQRKNVDRLIREARGDYIVLLHDDDRLLDGALATLLECFAHDQSVVAAYGKQQLTDADGRVRKEATRSLNEDYYRTAEYEGLSDSSLRAAVLQQFPNDGYMVQADVAKTVGYDHPGTGDACDFAFGVELALATEGTFYYTDTFTSEYRLSEDSIRGLEENDAAYWAVKTVLERIPDSVRRDPQVHGWVRERSPVAIMQAARNGHIEDGLRWYFSRHHRHRIATPGGIRRLGHLLYSYVAS